MTKVCLVGAGGKMGMRLTHNLKDHKDYQMSYLENSAKGIENLKKYHIHPAQ
jgi:N-acetyl-gamma-glutamylphosphate reductase